MQVHASLIISMKKDSELPGVVRDQHKEEEDEEEKEHNIRDE